MGNGVRATPDGLLAVAPPRYGLLSVPGVLSPGDPRWANGVGVESEGCDVPLDLGTGTPVNPGNDYPYWWTCPPGGQSAATAITSKRVGHGPTGTLASDPFIVGAGYTCSAVDAAARAADVSDRAQRKLLAIQGPAIEHELWTGEIAARANYPNDAFMDVGTLANLGWYGFVTALAELEQGLADKSSAGRTMIHAQPRVVTQWASRGLVGPNADRTALVTTQGTVVVPGHGYTGRAPTAVSTVPANYSQSYAYGTSWVNVWLGPIDTTTIDASTVERTLNDVVVRAERQALAIWDPCVHVGVRVSLCDEYCGVGS